jgi:Tektin family
VHEVPDGYFTIRQVQQEMSELEKTMELLRCCLKEKEAPLKVAQTRLAKRLDRPDIEACKDMAKLRSDFYKTCHL